MEWMNNLLPILKVCGIYFGIHFILFIIILIISMWKCFIKENIKGYYSLIPFYNIKLYFNMCNIPFWTIFIPVLNIIALIASSYRIAFFYRYNRKMSYVALFFPIIMLPIIAFSNNRSLNWKYSNMYIKNNEDVDKLEKKLVENINIENNKLPNKKEEKENKKIQELSNKVNETIDNLENSIKDDEYVYDDMITKGDKSIEELTSSDQPKEEFEEVFDDEISPNLMVKVEAFEKSIKREAEIKKENMNEVNEYNNNNVSDEAIAFGGESQIENVYSSQTKNDEGKCPRCGSPLIGVVNNICPGCGASLKDIIKE